jgi:hypothetical protein
MDGTGYTLLASSSTPFSGVVASFKLTDPNADLSHFHATVIWNDPGTFDWFTLPNPQITSAPIAPDGQGGFTVSVSNVNLGQFGWYHYQVLISDDRLGTGDSAIVGAAYGQVVIDTPIRPIPVEAGGGAIANAAGAVKISGGTSSAPDPALSEHAKFSANLIKGNAGHAISGNLGVLSGLASGTSASQLAGTIDWGDGTTTPAQFVKDHSGKIEVRGGHAYASPGTPTITLSLTQSLSGGSSNPPIHFPLEQTKAKVTGHARLGKYHATPAAPIRATAGQEFTGSLGLLSGPALSAGQSLQASIAWGDGSSSAAEIVSSSAGQWEINGSHIWLKKGNHVVHVVVTLVGSTHSVIARFAVHALIDAV